MNTQNWKNVNKTLHGSWFGHFDPNIFEIKGGVLTLKPEAINKNYLDTGLNVDEINAQCFPIIPEDGVFTTENVNSALYELAGKYFAYTINYASCATAQFFTLVSGLQSQDSIHQYIILNVPEHNDGLGTSNSRGILLNSAYPHRIGIVDSANGENIKDLLDNVVYGRLDYSSNIYKILLYVEISGVETPYLPPSDIDVKLQCLYYSDKFINIPWQSLVERCTDVLSVGALFVGGSCPAGADGPIGPVGPAGESIIWLGDWNTTSAYDPLDAVSYLGSSYISIATSINELPTNTAFWNLLAVGGQAGVAGPAGPQGLTWVGTWNNTDTYSLYSAVQYNGTAYIALNVNVGSQPDTNPLDWDLLVAKGADGIGGGSALVWRGPWSNTITYSVDDLIEFNGSSYVALLISVGSQPDINPTNWDLVAAAGSDGVNGADGADGASFVWRNDWAGATTYAIDEVVEYNGSSYIALTANTNSQPDTNPTDWDLLAAGGVDGADGADGAAGTNGTNGSDGSDGSDGLDGESFIWRGTWSSSTSYVANDNVESNGSSYISVTSNINSPPNALSDSLVVVDNNNDAEEFVTGLMDTGSSDLEFGDDLEFDEYKPTVGLRFTPSIPNGATINSASIQFRVDEVTTDPNCLIDIDTEAADNSAAFIDNVAGNLSSRLLTGASVGWNIPPWPTVGEQGANQATPDLTLMVQSVVNRPGWNSNQGMTFIFTPDGISTGTRTADSRDSTAAGAPMLTIDYDAFGPIVFTLGSGLDDGEEPPAGTVKRVSNDLELGTADGSDRTIAIRIPSVNVPQGSIISSANVQFTASAIETSAVSVAITVENADNSLAIDPSLLTNISSRSQTSSINWTIPAWNVVDEQGPAERTPDITPLIQAVINRPGWVSGNAIMIIFDGIGSANTRFAYASNSASPATQAATLNISWGNTDWDLLAAKGADGTGVATGSTLSWLGTWSNSTAYIIDNVVEYSGSSYVSLTSNTNSQPDTNPTDWDLVAAKGADGNDGAAGVAGSNGTSFVWQGAWLTTTTYALNDNVELNGSSYISLTSNTNSQPDTNPTDWDLLAAKGADGTGGGSALSWLGAWLTTTTYAIDDVIEYNGSSYISLTANTNSQPDTNPTDWDLLAAGGVDGSAGAVGTSFVWQGTWNNGTAYVLNDNVELNGSSYISLTSNTNSQPDTNPTDWDLLAAKGADGTGGGSNLSWLGAWLTTTAYIIDNAVEYNGSSYISLTSNTNSQPDTNPTDWDLLAAKGADGTGGGSALSWLGAWTGATTYAIDDIIEYNGSSYISLTANTNSQPDTNPTDWDLLAASGADGINGTNGLDGADGADGTSFTWRGLWNISTTYNINDNVEFNGSSYIALTVNLNSQPDTNPTDWDLIAAKGAGTNFTWVGTWLITTTYSIDEVIEFNGSSYLAITSNTNSQPDTNPTDWDLLASGGIDGASFIWRGAWNSAITYAINDNVEYDGSSYIAQTINNNNQPNISPVNWDLLAAKGAGTNFTWVGSWLITTNYSTDEVVEYNGSSYLALNVNLNSQPDINPSDWDLLAAGGVSFIWQGVWVPTTTYIVNNSVEYDGSSYIALNTNINSQPDINPTNWDLVAIKGAGTNFTWQNTWNSITSYSSDAVVEFNGSSYIALIANLSLQPDINPTEWDLLAAKGEGTNFTWVGEWLFATSYSLDEVVEYNGSSYVALTANSGIQPDANPTDWDLIAAGGVSFVWRGLWNNVVTYSVNDNVEYDGSSYTAILINTNSQPDTNPTDWDLVAAKGAGTSFAWLSNWINSTVYSIDAVVEFNGSSYIALTVNSNRQPDTNPTDWDLLAASGTAGINGISFIWRGAWVSTTSYIVNDNIEFNGSSYLAINANINSEPDTNPTDWDLLAAKGDGTSFNWLGVWISTTSYSIDAVVEFNGSSYIALTVNLNSQPDTNPADWDLIAAKGDGTSLNWLGPWLNTTTYNIDDLIEFDGNSYIALTVNTNSQPDTNPTDWDLVAAKGDDGVAGVAGATGTGIIWQGTFVLGTNYVPNDVVEYEGGAYINILATSTTLPTVTSRWNLMVASGGGIDGISFIWRGLFVSGTSYVPNDVVEYEGSAYINILATSTSLPTIISRWELIASAGTNGLDGISFIWQGVWDSATLYTPNDVVEYLGSSYISIITSTNWLPNNGTSRWNLIASAGIAGLDGTNLLWRDVWDSATVYIPNDIVEYNGSIYISIITSTNWLPTNGTSRWNLMTKGFYWRGAWSSTTSYFINDIVEFEGSSFIALLANINIPTTNNTRWDLIASKGLSFVWRGTWVSTTAYVINDSVEYNGSSYNSITSNTNSQPDTNPTDWDLVAAKGAGTSFLWTSTWVITTNYSIDEVVEFNGSSYIALAANFNSQPDTNPTDWDLVAAKGDGTSFSWLGLWASTTSYGIDEVVEFNGSSYIALISNLNSQPDTNPTDWDLVAAKGDGTSFSWASIWVNTTTYSADEIVEFNGSSYIALTSNTNSSPDTNPTDWDLFTAKGAGFIWLGNWDNSVSYIIDDTVEFNGSSYIALTPNTNSSPDTNPTDWDLSAAKGDTGDGFIWRGVFSLGTTYVPNDVVRYDGHSYINTVNNSGTVLPTDISRWDLMVSSGNDGLAGTGFIWRDAWDVATVYLSNDVVQYNGSTYISITGSFGNLPTDISRWDLMTSAGDDGLDGVSFVWKGIWNIATLYNPDEVVEFNGGSYISITGGLGWLPTDNSRWNLMVSGFSWKGLWISTTSYIKNDVVEYIGSSYIALVTNTNSQPDTNPTDWELSAAKGLSFTWRGAWVSTTSYVINDSVGYNGSSYNSITVNLNSQPDTNPTDWDLIAAKGAGTSLNWLGLWLSTNTYNIDEAVEFDGSSYISLTVNLNSQPDINPTDWDLIAAKGAGTSLNWLGLWSNTTSYNTDEVVEFNGSSYIALVPNLNSQPNTNPTDWDLVAAKGDGTSFSWLSSWSNATLYNIDEVAEFNGSSYIALTVNNNSQPDTNPTDWDLMVAKGDTGSIGLTGNDGTSFIWQGTFVLGTVYVPNDIVEYLGGLYINTVSNVGSVLPTTTSRWDILVAKGTDGADGASFIWRGTFVGGTSYIINDVVEYLGSIYINILANSTGIAPTNTSRWEPMVLSGTDGLDGVSFIWRGTFVGGTSYVINDVVEYNGSSYINKIANSSGILPTNVTWWGLMASGGTDGLDGVGFIWRGTFVGGTSYVINDVVEYDGNIYTNKIANSTGILPTNVTWWSLMIRAFTWRGTWLSTNPYLLNEIVEYNGSSYISIKLLGNNTNSQPDTNPADWDLVAEGQAGAAGAGVAAGGTADQVLTKVDATDFNTVWAEPLLSFQSFTLPPGATMADRVAGATNIPVGWTISTADVAGIVNLGALATTLVVIHNMGMFVYNVSILEKLDTGPASIQGYTRINFSTQGNQRNSLTLNEFGFIDLQVFTTSTRELTVIMQCT